MDVPANDDEQTDTPAPEHEANYPQDSPYAQDSPPEHQDLEYLDNNHPDNHLDNHLDKNYINHGEWDMEDYPAAFFTHPTGVSCRSCSQAFQSNSKLHEHVRQAHTDDTTPTEIPPTLPDDTEVIHSQHQASPQLSGYAFRG